MNVLSLFDGMSCGRTALDRARIRVGSYFASEVDESAIAVAQANWPDNKQMGDVRHWRAWNIDWASVDLLLAGSPCQGFSRMGDRLNFDDERSRLFFDFVDILNHIKRLNPAVKFLLENVHMRQDWANVISSFVGVSYHKINSRLLVPQNRPRMYWANFPISPPTSTERRLIDVLEDGTPVDAILSTSRIGWIERNPHKLGKYFHINPPVSSCLTARGDAGWNTTYITRNGLLTRLTPIEWERLQGLPDNYTAVAPIKERYKMLGNGWTVDVIAHIFNCMQSGHGSMQPMLDFG